MARQRLGGHRAAPDDASRGGEPAGDLAGREDRGVLGDLRGAGGGLHAAARRRRARPPDARRQPRERRRLDAGRRDPLRHAAVFDAAQHAARAGSIRRPACARCFRSRRPATARTTRRLDAVLHAPALPGQPHAALQGRHGAEPLEVDCGRGGGDAAHRRLRRHQQDADAVERPRLLRQRPRRVDEHLVDGRERPRPQAAHEASGLRRAVAVALERPYRLPAGRRHPAARHRQRRRQGRVDHARLRLRSAPRAVGEERHRLGVLRAPLAERRSRRPHRARPGVRRARPAGPHRRGHAQSAGAVPQRAIHAGRTVGAGAVRRKRRGRVLAPAGQRRRRAHAALERRQGAALGRRAVARRQLRRAPRQEPAAVDPGCREEDPEEGGRVGQRELRRHRLVARQPVAGLHGPGAEPADPHLPLRGRDRAHRPGDVGSLRLSQPGVEPGRQVALLPVEPELRLAGRRARGGRDSPSRSTTGRRRSTTSR